MSGDRGGVVGRGAHARDVARDVPLDGQVRLLDPRQPEPPHRTAQPAPRASQSLPRAVAASTANGLPGGRVARATEIATACAGVKLTGGRLADPSSR